MTRERALPIAQRILGGDALLMLSGSRCCVYTPAIMCDQRFLELRASGTTWLDAIADLNEWHDAQQRNEDRLRRFKRTGTRVPVQGDQP